MSPTLASVRGRALGVTFSALAVAFGALGLVPLPLHTVAEGVIWLPEESIVRAGADGFVTEFLAQPGSAVRRGTQLLRSEDRELEATILVQQARVAAAAARLGAQERDNPQRTEVARRALAVETSALSHATELSQELEVRSKTEGIFVVPRADDVIGRFYRRGEMLGYIAAPSKSTARVLVRQDDVDLVRRWLRGAQVRMSSRMSQVFTARLVREVPAASTEFPSVALTLEGGGSQAADPTDTAVPRALSRLFQFDVELSPVAARSAAMGEHVWVRFYHGVEPLAFQWWRRIRQLFLSRFNA